MDVKLLHLTCHLPIIIFDVILDYLPFTHSIIEPFMVFNPYVTESIEEAILLVITKNQHNNFGKNIIRIENKISQILSMIYNGKV